VRDDLQIEDLEGRKKEKKMDDCNSREENEARGGEC